MVMMNGNSKEMKVNTNRFAELMNGKIKAKNVITDESVPNLNEITIPAMTTLILQLE